MGQTIPSYQTKLSTLQNKAIKFSCGGSYQDHVDPYFEQLGVLELPDLRNHETAKFVHLHFQKNYLHNCQIFLVKQVKSRLD